jgi:hypothetical protein
VGQGRRPPKKSEATMTIHSQAKNKRQDLASEFVAIIRFCDEIGPASSVICSGGKELVTFRTLSSMRKVTLSASQRRV